MTKKRTRKEKKRLIIISLAIIGLLISLVSSLYSDFMDIMTNKKTIVTLTSEYENLLDRQASLESEVTKMQDPNYIVRYAKEKFLYSSNGDIIIRMD